jgi:hypothetical protein
MISVSIFLATTLASASVCPKPTTPGPVVTNVKFSALLQESKGKDLFYRLKPFVCFSEECTASMEYESDEKLKVFDIQCEFGDVL